MLDSIKQFSRRQIIWSVVVGLFVASLYYMTADSRLPQADALAGCIFLFVLLAVFVLATRRVTRWLGDGATPRHWLQWREMLWLPALLGPLLASTLFTATLQHIDALSVGEQNTIAHVVLQHGHADVMLEVLRNHENRSGVVTRSAYDDVLGAYCAQARVWDCRIRDLSPTVGLMTTTPDNLRGAQSVREMLAYMPTTDNQISIPVASIAGSLLYILGMIGLAGAVAIMIYTLFVARLLGLDRNSRHPIPSS